MSDSAVHLPEIMRFDDGIRFDLVRADSLPLIEDAKTSLAVDAATNEAVRDVISAQKITYENWRVRDDFEYIVNKFTSTADGDTEPEDSFQSGIVDRFVADLRGDADFSTANAAARQRIIDLHGRVNSSDVDEDDGTASIKDRGLFGGITQARKSGSALDMNLATVASLVADFREAKTPQEAEDLRYKLWYLLDKQDQRFRSVTEVHDWQERFLGSVQFRQDARTTATLFNLASAIVDPETGVSIVHDIQQRFAPNVRRLRRLAEFNTNLISPELHAERDEFLDLQFEVIIERLDRITTNGYLDGASEVVVRQGLHELIEKVESQTIEQKLGNFVLSLSGLFATDVG